MKEVGVSSSSLSFNELGWRVTRDGRTGGATVSISHNASGSRASGVCVCMCAELASGYLRQRVIIPLEALIKGVSPIS